MKILLIEPNKRPVEKEISGSLASMQELVGGTIQAIYPFEEPVALICNDEAKLQGMEMNRMLNEIGDVICGPFFLCGAPPTSEDFASLSNEQLSHYSSRFHSIELFLPVGDSVFVLKA